MFIKQNKAVNTYAYRMLLSFKTSVTYINFFNFKPDISVRCEAPSSDITRFFAGHCPISDANIQACMAQKLLCKEQVVCLVSLQEIFGF